MEPENTDTNESMMDHDEAARIDACTRYLVGDLSPSEAEAFEEHFFSCAVCAEEVRLGDLLSRHIREAFEKQARGVKVGHSRWSWLDRFSVFALPAAAAAGLVLGVAIYQNVFVIPRLRTQVAALTAPQAVAWVPLKIARGADSVLIPRDKSFWMAYFNIPNPGAYPSYNCEIETSGGEKNKTIKSVSLPAPTPGLPSSILLRRSDFPSGTYIFRILGQGSTVPVVSYTIELNTE
jgi:hypothetical protein